MKKESSSEKRKSVKLNQEKKLENQKIMLPLGKLKTEILKQIFNSYNKREILEVLEQSPIIKKQYEDNKKRVVLGFGIGEDAAIIDIGDKYLAYKTDPITFTTDAIGHYVVNINANDIAAMGGIPKWFLVTILLPAEKTTLEMAENICLDIQHACLNMGIILIGGHTEVTYGLERPIVIGSILGEVEKDKMVLTSGGKPGDAIILTKGIPLEGTSIIAREKENYLRSMGVSEEFIQNAKQMLFTPGISVFKEARLAVENFKIHAMHDPTEGGLAMGLVEMAIASKCGFIIKRDSIPIIPEGEKLCKIFNLDPLRVIASGSLLICVDERDCEPLIKLLRSNNINAEKIGTLTQEKDYKILIDGTLKDLEYSEKDQITKIL